MYLAAVLHSTNGYGVLLQRLYEFWKYEKSFWAFRKRILDMKTTKTKNIVHKISGRNLLSLKYVKSILSLTFRHSNPQKGKNL